MKAAVVEKPGRLVVRQVQEPEIGEYDALCELLYGSTCTGTDQHIIDNVLPWPIVYPTVLGHESIGRVVEVGAKVRHFQIGDLVTRVGTPPPGDGSNTVTWGGFTEYGIARDHWQARRDGLPKSFWDAHRVNQIVPAGIDPGAATMIITLRETLSYVLRMGFAAGKSALVIGSGGTGLAFVAHAHHMGLVPIACVGSEARQSTARSAGSSLWADYRNKDCVEQLSQQHPAGFDFIIDSVGREGSLRSFVPLLADQGTIAVYGLDEPTKVTISPFAHGTYHVYNGGYDEEETHQRVIDLLRRGAIDVRVWLDPESAYPLNDINDAFTALRERKLVKAVVKLR
jgi:D-arabinose 1-dehydrogenase-like Zn-dependent alcohol dehydrogenase